MIPACPATPVRYAPIMSAASPPPVATASPAAPAPAPSSSSAATSPVRTPSRSAPGSRVDEQAGHAGGPGRADQCGERADHRERDPGTDRGHRRPPAPASTAASAPSSAYPMPTAPAAVSAWRGERPPRAPIGPAGVHPGPGQPPDAPARSAPAGRGRTARRRCAAARRGRAASRPARRAARRSGGGVLAELGQPEHQRDRQVRGEGRPAGGDPGGDRERCPARAATRPRGARAPAGAAGTAGRPVVGARPRRDGGD